MVKYIVELTEKARELPVGVVKDFLTAYLPLREMVYSFLLNTPEEKLDYKPADKREVQDLRECFAELVRVETSLIKGLKTGIRQMGAGHNALPEKPVKQEILQSLEKADRELFEVITQPSFKPYSNIIYQDKNRNELRKTLMMWMVWGLRNHENMHLGMIRRDLDAIGIPPSKEYTKYWYG